MEEIMETNKENVIEIKGLVKKYKMYNKFKLCEICIKYSISKTPFSSN